MLVFDFFAGTRSSTQAFEDAGHTVISFDNDFQFDVTVFADVFELTAESLIARYGQPDFVWASPPCTAFSVASISHHWQSSRVPKTDAAEQAIKLVAHTRELLEILNPRFGWVMENPRGMLRKLDVVAGLTRYTVSYCRYGDDRMKPTDLWTTVKNWEPRPMCKNGDSCHVAAPRGAKTGTQGLKGATMRSMVPYELSEEIRKAITNE
jgi:hypothetical protein